MKLIADQPETKYAKNGKSWQRIPFRLYQDGDTYIGALRYHDTISLYRYAEIHQDDDGLWNVIGEDVIETLGELPNTEQLWRLDIEAMRLLVLL